MGPQFINRELSWLDFNARVLSLASEPSIPLLERLKFIAIYSRNLDEFFQVRVGALHDQVEAKLSDTGFDGLTAVEQLVRIRERALELTARRDEILSTVLTDLAGSGVEIQDRDALAPAEKDVLDQFFNERILPVLTPLAVDPAHPFPYISGLSLNIGVFVTDPTTDETRFARLKVPTTVNRFVPVAPRKFVRIETVIGDRLHLVFPGMLLSSWSVFRVTRNTDLMIHREEAEDLLAAVELELRRRRFGNAVRIEVEREVDNRIIPILLEELELDEVDIFVHDGPLDASAFHELVGLEEQSLHDRPWKSVTAGRLVAAAEKGKDFFEVIKFRDLMVHHPYESFSTSTEEFIRAAAADDRVRTIKATLYRTSANSDIADSLIAAAERGVQVVALIELTARFDEQVNMEWAKRLEEAGAHVVYGVVGLKIHAKCMLVVREEADGLRRYAHIGTGNYNSTTARIYEDIGYFTCDDLITEDVSDLFNYLTGFSQPPLFRELVTAPQDFRPWVIKMIDNEARHGTEGRISLKMNGLADGEIINALIRAAERGVHIDLLVRGICCLNLGAVGNSNIRVRSVLGRYLEHSRIYRFAHGGTDGGPSYHVGSGDLMKRNLDLRVEAFVPIRHQKHRRWIDTFLETMWSDNVVRFELGADQEWHRRGPDDFVFEHDAQGQVMQWATTIQQAQSAALEYDMRDDTSPAGMARPASSWLGRIRVRMLRPD